MKGKAMPMLNVLFSETKEVCIGEWEENGVTKPLYLKKISGTTPVHSENHITIKARDATISIKFADIYVTDSSHGIIKVGEYLQTNHNCALLIGHDNITGGILMIYSSNISMFDNKKFFGWYAYTKI